MSDKYTINLFSLISAELYRSGKNPKVNNGYLTLKDKNYQFIYKIMKYDEDVQKIVNNSIFYGFTFNNPEMDIWFKKTFINRYLNNKLKNQTIEHMNILLVAYLEMHRQGLELLWENYENIFSGGSSSITTGNKETENNGRAVAQTNPQDAFNLNVRDYNFDTVDAASGNNTLGTEKASTSNNTKTYNVNDIEKTIAIYEKTFRQMKKLVFSKFY
ncbi:hypothetical protein OIH30_10315 [Lactococcus petauri]|uniref:hypothetical protein n=1 Tax=Lactococcus petauri TaxID=1940789 RepID=UPI0021F0E416|nr:hypothetical protein [Lactococcus petauri]MCV5953914.1 hypothetical protein [Lactococcus petauri]